MKSNFNLIEEISMKCEVTIEPSFIVGAWEIMFIEEVDKSKVANFIQELFLNNVDFKLDGGRVIIFEKVEL